MNSVFITGNLAKEPEVSTTKTEWSVIKFGIANNDESKKQDDGSWEHVVSFFDCEYWTKNPQLWLNKLQKGVGVAIQGHLKQDTWQADDGSSRHKVKLVVEKFPLVLQGKTASKEVTTPAEDDDIPF